MQLRYIKEFKHDNLTTQFLSSQPNPKGPYLILNNYLIKKKDKIKFFDINAPKAGSGNLYVKKEL